MTEKKENSYRRELILTKELNQKILYLCSKIDKVEWSGPLFVKVVEGDVNNPNGDIIIEASDLFLMDIGTGATTEYEYVTPDDERLMDLYERNPEMMEYRMASVHSHNTMSAFMSGTDDNELKKGSKNSDFYLMLVVNNKTANHWVAQVGMMVEVEKEIKSHYKFFNGNFRNLNKKVTEDVFYSYEFDVFVEDEDHDFSELDRQIEETEAIKEKERKAFVHSYNPINNGKGFNNNHSYHNGHRQDSLWGGEARDFNDGYPTSVKKEKTTFEGRRLAFDTIDINGLYEAQIIQGVLSDHLLSGIIKDNFDAIVEQGMNAAVDLAQTSREDIMSMYAEELMTDIMLQNELVNDVLSVLSDGTSDNAIILNKLLTELIIEEKYGVTNFG